MPRCARTLLIAALAGPWGVACAPADVSTADPEAARLDPAVVIVDEPEPTPEPEPYDPEPPSRPSRPRPSPGPSSGPVLTLSTAQLDTGFKKARSSINACAKKNGALEGTNLQISFDVVDGRATNIKVQPPYGPTPLGRCVAAAVDANARFAAAKEPSRAVTRKVSF